MKMLINISGTHGYPEGIIPHMAQAVQAFYYHLNFFYDANILIDMANRQKSRNKSDKKESK